TAVSSICCALYPASAAAVTIRPMPADQPRIEPQDAEGGALVRVLGPWTATRLGERHLLRGLQARLGEAPRGGWDITPAQLDHVGAQLLWDHWGQRWPERLEALPGQRSILERVAKYTVQRPPRRPRTFVDAYLAFGDAI